MIHSRITPTIRNDARARCGNRPGGVGQPQPLTSEAPVSCGDVCSDPTDPVYAGDATTLLLNNFPPNPCLAATNDITGTVAIGAP